MQQNLVIRLDPADPSTATWITVDSLGNRSGGVESGPLSAIGDLQIGCRVVVLVPSADVFLTKTQVPGRGARMLQALPYALEEQLVEDVEDLHFSIGTRSDGHLPIAVVRRSLIENWLAALTEAGVKPHALIPEALVLPTAPGGDTLLIEPGFAQLRTNEGGHAAFEFSEVAELENLIVLANNQRENPAPMSIYLTREDHQQLRNDLESLRELTGGLEFRAFVDGPLPNLAMNAVRNPAIDLLQGGFAPRSNVDKAWRPWRLAAAILLGLVSVVLIGDVVKIMRYDKQHTELSQSIATTFRSVLPNVPISSPIDQLESELRRIQGGPQDPESFFLFLDALTQAIAANGESRVVDLEYRSGELNLRVDVASVDTLESIVRKLEKESQIAAEIASTTPEGPQVRGQLRLKMGES